MNYLDYVIIAIALIGFLLGFRDGLIRKLIGLVGFIAAIALAIEFSDNLGKILTPFFNYDDYLASIISGILIFLVVILITSIIKRIVHPLDKVNRFINQLVGGIIGTAQIIFFLSGFLLFLDIFGIPPHNDKNNSLFFNPVHDIIPATFDMVIGRKSKASDIIKSFIENKDNIINSEIDSIKTKEK